jgi:small redox-active disulfide protein 2
MRLQILGGGCSKCKTLEANARAAIEELGLEAEVEKITDFGAIAAMGVMTTPALAVDGEVKSAGRVLSKDQIIPIIRGGK